MRRVEAMINKEGNASFCFRAPQIARDQLDATGFEVSIYGTGYGSLSKTVGRMEFGRWGESRTVRAPASVRFSLEVIALGRHILVKADHQIIIDLYDVSGKYNRGHFLLRQIGAATEVEFLRLEVKSVDLGNDPKELAKGARPRWVVVRSSNGKHYLVIPDVLPWQEARIQCTNLGGRLAMPSSDSENRFLTALVKDRGIDGSWLGATPDFREI